MAYPSAYPDCEIPERFTADLQKGGSMPPFFAITLAPR